jgi:cell wall-associated NlpC family hydrolase
VQYVYRAAGVVLPRTTYAQYAAGVPVTGELRPGDVVFFYPSAAGPEHEGLYVGHGYFVEAPHTGASVSLRRLADYVPMVGARCYGDVCGEHRA